MIKLLKKSKISNERKENKNISTSLNDKKTLISIIGASACFIIFSFLINFSGFSIANMVNIQNSFLQSAILNSSLSDSLSTFLNSFFYVIISIIFLTLGFSFLSSYGYYDDRVKTGLISGIIGAIFILFFFNASVIGIFFSIALIITSAYVIPLSNTYGKEFKKWTRFRVGSNSLGKTFMIINVFIALGIFLSVSSSMSFYQDNFKKNLATSLTTLTAVPQGFEGVVNQTALNQETEKFISQVIDNSPFFQIYLRWLPILLAFGAWVVLEFLRTFIFSNLGGIFTFVLIKMNKN